MALFIRQNLDQSRGAIGETLLPKALFLSRPRDPTTPAYALRHKTKPLLTFEVKFGQK